MYDPFRTAIAAALPDPEAVHARLHIMSHRDRMNVADLFTGVLPDVDVLIATPGAEGLSQELSGLRGVPTVSLARLGPAWMLVGSALHQPGKIRPMRQRVKAAVVSVELQDGQPELAATLLAGKLNWDVLGVAAAAERSDASGPVRLALMDVPVFSAVMLAGTPQGLVFERRIPQRHVA